MLSVLLATALSPTIIGGQEGIKHVMEGEEYLVNTKVFWEIVIQDFWFICFFFQISRERDPKAARSLCTEVPEDKFKSCHQSKGDNRSFYDFSSEDIEKLNNVSFDHPDYVGKVLLVVNLASFWGYTPQYYALNALTEQYSNKPFKILGFPCNQFLRQVNNWNLWFYALANKCMEFIPWCTLYLFKNYCKISQKVLVKLVRKSSLLLGFNVSICGFHFIFSIFFSCCMKIMQIMNISSTSSFFVGCGVIIARLSRNITVHLHNYWIAKVFWQLRI